MEITDRLAHELALDFIRVDFDPGCPASYFVQGFQNPEPQNLLFNAERFNQNVGRALAADRIQEARNSAPQGHFLAGIQEIVPERPIDPAAV